MKSDVIENFEEKKNAWSLVRREHGIALDDADKIVIKKRMSDGIPNNTTVDGECRKIKVWYYEQIEAESDIYKLDSKNFSILSIGRREDLHCIDPRSIASIIRDIQQRELVVRRDIIKYKDDDHLLRGHEIAPKDKFPDTLEREYCAFYLGSSDEETETKDFDIHFELNNEKSDVVFFKKPSKSDSLRDQGFGETIGIGDSFCKIAVKPEVNEKKQVPLQDTQFKRFFKKGENGMYEVVYRSETSKDFVRLNGVTSLTDFRNKHCVMDCSKIDSKPNLWRSQSENLFRRVNFVDLVANPTKTFCGETKDKSGKKIPTSNSAITREEEIDKERFKYDEAKDVYKIRFEYNSEKFFYFRGDPKYQVEMTECDVGYTYETVKPTKKDIDERRWIYVNDRTCVNVNPCDKIFHTNLNFEFSKTIDNIPPYGYMKIEALKVPKISQFMNCKGIQINCNLTVRGIEDVLNIRPLFVIKKMNKEVVLKAILGETGQTSLLVGNEQDSGEKPTTVKCEKEESIPPNTSGINLFLNNNEVLSPYESEDAALSWHSSWKKDVAEVDCAEKEFGEVMNKKEKVAYKLEKSIEESGGSLFQEFNVFENDVYEFWVKTGTSTISITDLSVVMKCQHPEIVAEPATYSSNNTCDIQKYDTCDYDTEFQDRNAQFKCTKYSVFDKTCPSMKTSESDEAPCDVEKVYQKYATRKQDLDVLHNDSTDLNINFSECQKLCDERVGCTGVDYHEQIRECIFRGHETYKIKFHGIDQNAKRKVTIFYDDDKKQDTDVGDLNVFTLSKPGHIKQITVVGGSFKMIELFRHDNTLYKTYSAVELEKYRHTPQLMIIDDIYADSVDYETNPPPRKIKTSIGQIVPEAKREAAEGDVKSEGGAEVQNGETQPNEPKEFNEPGESTDAGIEGTEEATVPEVAAEGAPAVPDPSQSSDSPTQTQSENAVNVVVPDDEDSRARCYGARYYDLRAAFGSDYGALNDHYTSTGATEKRDNSCTLSDAEAQCYLNRYEDVQDIAGTDLNLARNHYYDTGMSENRDFVCPPGVKELKCYVQKYADLQDAFGTDYDARGVESTLYKAGQHWHGFGKKENRDYSCEETPAA